jgi:hypothetical protein
MRVDAQCLRWCQSRSWYSALNPYKRALRATRDAAKNIAWPYCQSRWVYWGRLPYTHTRSTATLGIAFHVAHVLMEAAIIYTVESQ